MGQEINAKMRQAAMAGETEVVRALLEQGAEVNSFGLGGYTAIMDAASEGHFKIVKLLVENGAEINRRDGEYGSNAFTNAVNKGHCAIASYLLGNDAVVEDDLETIFEAIVENNDVEMARVFLDAGISFDVLWSGGGFTPMMEACRLGRIELVKLFFEAGAGDFHGLDDLLHFATAGTHGVVYRLLVEQGAKPEIVSAAQAGVSELVEKFLKQGVSVNSTNDRGVTPLLGAIEGNHLQLVALLLEHGADVNTPYPGQDEMHALKIAQECAGSEIVEMIRKRQ